MTKLNLIDAIKANKQLEGEPMTATQVCERLGLKDPTKSTLNLVAKILRNDGLPEKRTGKGKYFYCSDWSAFFEKAKAEAATK